MTPFVHIHVRIKDEMSWASLWLIDVLLLYLKKEVFCIEDTWEKS